MLFEIVPNKIIMQNSHNCKVFLLAVFEIKYSRSYINIYLHILKKIYLKKCIKMKK